MPFSHNWEEKGVVVTFSGVITSNEVMKANNQIIGDPRFDNLLYQIFDFGNIDKIISSDEEAKMIGIMDKSSTRWNKRIKVACITNKDYIIEMINEYAEMLKETEWDVGVFKDLDDAYSFVGKTDI